MKIAALIASLALALVAVGCSKKEEAAPAVPAAAAAPAPAPAAETPATAPAAEEKK